MKNKNAFSLVELLISLIIISLIVAAFVPVMTKKFTQTIGLQTSRKFEEALLTYGDNRKAGLYDCKVSEDKTYSDCKFVVPEGVSELVAVIVGGGGGGASGVSAFIEKDIAASSDNLATSAIELEKTIKIEDGMQNVRITNLVGAGGGGSAGFRGITPVAKKFIENCPLNTIKVKGSDKSEYCITKYNIRPVSLNQYHNSQNGVLPVKSTVFDLEIPIPVPENYFNFASGDIPPYYGDYNSPTNTVPACWVSPNTGCSSGGIYPGCARTVCNWYAADEMCKIIDFGGKNCSAQGTKDGIYNDNCKGLWRLPTEKELWGSSGLFIENFKGTFGENNTLSLCDAGSTSIYCRIYSNSAYGSYENTAFPAGIWGDSYTDTSAKLGYIQDGQFRGLFAVPKIAARSVRCVLKATNEQRYLDAPGGMGSSGTGVINVSIPIPNEIIKENVGAEIKLIAGEGGKGGGKRPDSPYPTGDASDCNYIGGGCLEIDEVGLPGQDGNYSSVLVVKNNQILWGYRVNGGYGSWNADPYKRLKAARPPFKVDETTGSPLYDENGDAILDNEKAKPLCEKYNPNAKEWEVIDCPSEAKRALGTNAGINEDSEGSIGICNGDSRAASLNIDLVYPEITKNYGRGGACGKAMGKGIWSPGGFNYTNIGYAGISGWATIKYDKITSRGVSGGGGSGACASRIEHISVKSGDEFKIRVGRGGEGGISPEVTEAGNDGQNGSSTVVELPSVFKITALGGNGGKVGANSDKNSIADGIGGRVVDCSSVSDDLIPDNIKKNIVFLYTGKQGENGVFGKDVQSESTSDEKKTDNAIGGNGGIAGFYQVSGYTYTQGGCGGYSDLGLCASNPNKYNYGLSADAYDPFKLYSGKTYGTFGSGGGGGGWLYDFEKNERAGSGGRGLDGYVYLYWYR